MGEPQYTEYTLCPSNFRKMVKEVKLLKGKTSYLKIKFNESTAKLILNRLGEINERLLRLEEKSIKMWGEPFE